MKQVGRSRPQITPAVAQLRKWLPGGWTALHALGKKSSPFIKPALVQHLLHVVFALPDCNILLLLLCFHYFCPFRQCIMRL